MEIVSIVIVLFFLFLFLIFFFILLVLLDAWLSLLSGLVTRQTPLDPNFAIRYT